MNQIQHSFFTRFRRSMAKGLLTTLLAAELIPAMPLLEALALPTTPSFGNIWEKLEEKGEVMLSYPATIYSDLSSAEDVDCFTFTLTEKTDLSVSLDGADCKLELLKGDALLGLSALPHEQFLEEKGLEPGTYGIRISSLSGGGGSDYRLQLQDQKSRSSMPSYSPAHVGGATYDKRSPYRALTLPDDKKDKGGNSYDVVHYLAHWQGPVNESVLPYYQGNDYRETPSNYIHYKPAEPNYHVQEALYLPGQESDGYEEHWKNALMAYGALDSAFCANYEKSFHDGRYPYLYTPEGFEDEMNVFHATTIVGWDDTFPKEKFWFGTASDSNAIRPERDGAWICKDSYGSEYFMTDDGYFYISYEDATLGAEANSFQPVCYQLEERSDNYSHLYSNSASGVYPLSWIDSDANNPSYVGKSISVGEFFKSGDEPELLRAVGFACFTGELSYEISFVYITEGELVVEDPIKTGYEKYGGFHTVRLDSGYLIPPNTEFGIMVRGESPNSSYVDFGAAYGTINSKDPLKRTDETSFIVYDDTVAYMYSWMGVYPYILAYTYGTGDQEITIMDNRAILEPEPSDDPELPATPSNAADSTRREKEEKQTPLQAGYQGAIALPYEDPTEHEPLFMEFPERYDLRDENLVTPPKNQGASNLCWAFSGMAALESSYLKRGSNLINYPKGLLLSLADSEEVISDGILELKMEPGKPLDLSFCADLLTDSEDFNPGNNQIYWEASGLSGSYKLNTFISENGEDTEVLTINSPGTYTVTATSLADTYLTVSCKIVVTEKVPARITLNQSELTLKVGELYKLEAQVEAEEELTVLYTSADPYIAEVAADGTIFALHPGTTVITARAGEASAQCTVTVTRKSGSSGSSSYSPTEKHTGPSFDLTGSSPDTISGSWKQNETGWWFERPDRSYPTSSWQKIGGKWYYFKPDGYMATGWYFEEGAKAWYYLGDDGAMRTGWCKDMTYGGWFWLEPSGAMATGWQHINGKWYYFHEVSDGSRGRMYENQTTPDGYFVGSDGAWIS